MSENRNDTPELELGELLQIRRDKLARLRQQRDSLQVAFDTQCAMVRLIREKRKG